MDLDRSGCENCKITMPLVEESYQRHRDAIAKHNDGVLQGPLAKLMRRTRERLALLLETGCDSGESICERPVADLTGVSDAVSTPSSEPATGAVPVLFTPPQGWNQTPLSLETASEMATDIPVGTPPSMDVSDQSCRMWEEFVAGISVEEFGSPSMFLYEDFDD